MNKGMTWCQAPHCDKRRHCRRSVYWPGYPEQKPDEKRSFACFWSRGLFDCGYWLPLNTE